MALNDYASSIVNGAALIGSYLGIGEKRQDKRQVEQQEALNNVNAKTARQQADYEQALKLKMWKDTNYSAQLKEAEKAGVSKAAAIGGAGSGVGQGASVNSISGGGAADAAAATQAGTNKMMAQAQLGLMTAQKDNLNADTQDKLAGAANKGAQTANTGVDTETKKLALDTLTQTQRDTIKTAAYSAEQEAQKTQMMWNERKISDETYQSEIQKIRNEAIGSGVDIAVKELGMKLDRRKVNALEQAVQQAWQRLTLERREVTVKELAQASQDSYMRQSNTHRGNELTQREWEAIGNFAIGTAGAVTRGGAPNGMTEEIDRYDKDGNQTGSQVRKIKNK